jgi:archaeosine synthase
MPVLDKTKVSKKVHVLVASTPGVVPFELSYRYPFDKYDWPEWEETEKVKEKYLEVTEERVYNYLKAHKKHYKKYYCYLKPDSETYRAVHNACKRLKIKVVDVLSEKTWDKVKDERNPLSLPEALKDVSKI